MAILQAIIVTILASLFGLVFDMNSASDQTMLQEQIYRVLFDQETYEEGVIVTRVVDGDTIVVRENGEDYKVRLIGIDTPETVDPRKEVECFGKEASDKTTQLLEGQQVRLEKDFSQGDADTYGRLLRYVFLENDLHVNLELVKTGYAHEYTYDLPYLYQTEFQEAEQEAREQHLGLWGELCQFE